MSTYSFDLNFIDERSGEPVDWPAAEIHLQIRSTRKGDDRQFVVTDCRSKGELDFRINGLHEELEILRSRAHKEFDAFWKRESKRA